MTRYYTGTYEWLAGLGSTGNVTCQLLGPLLAIVGHVWPGDPEHLGYAARCTALRVVGDEDEADRIGLAAYVCNIGMVGWLERLTANPGPLSVEERRQVEQHARLGAGLLRGWEAIDPTITEIALAVQHHHERWDGRGYPDGLEGDAIPFGSRVICVAEAFQAMLSPRPYREPLAEEIAKARIAKAAGAQFDPDVATAFIAWRNAEERDR
jgi:HD-GYP domain-containing protein (c-di-GMP phosphodiesterase class II)